MKGTISPQLEVILQDPIKAKALFFGTLNKAHRIHFHDGTYLQLKYWGESSSLAEKKKKRNLWDLLRGR